MSARFRGRITYANVMATTAVFVALGGGAYAAASLPKNSVGPRQLRKNAVSSSKVKDRSLLAKDFAKGQLPRGAPGLPGTARAYAHVGSNGILDVAHSKNVIDVRPECSGPCSAPPAAGADAKQCFKLSFTPVSAVASVDWADPGSDPVLSTVVMVRIPGTPTPTAPLTSGCAPGYMAAETLTTRSTDGTIKSAGFYVVFN